MHRSGSMSGQSRLRFPVRLAATAAFAVLGLTDGALGQTFVVTGTPITTAFSGNRGGDHVTQEKNTNNQQQAMHGIGGKEQSDDPCDLLLFYQDFTTHPADQPLREFLGCTTKDGTGKSSSYIGTAGPDGFFVTGMAVCLNSDRDKVKGLYSEAYPIACLAGRSTATIPDPLDETKTRTVTCGTPEATFRDPFPGEHTNCPGSRNGYDADWEPIVHCPAGKVATGVTLNLRKRSNGRRYYDGLALRCRTVANQ